MRFLDTNILLRYLTRDDEEKASRSLALLRRVERNEEKVTTSPLVLFETVFTLGKYYGLSPQQIRERLVPLIQLRGMKLERSEIYVAALDLHAETGISFADCFNACFMRESGFDETYSFDHDLERLPGVRRIEP
jgi:predicted nucleic acid-binding protein